MTRFLLIGRRGVVPALALLLWTGASFGQTAQVVPGTVGHSGKTYDVEYGSFHVPMNRRDPDSSLIELKFVRYKSTASQPADPAVYLAGGPGGSGIGTMRSGRARAFLALLDERDFIAFDQRGTGQSEPHNLRVGESVQLPLDQAGDPDRLCEIARQSAEAALASLRRRGIDPWGLTTEQSADDLDDLRRVVGARKLVLWGSSYGTHLALATVRRHPDAVAAVILAGTWSGVMLRVRNTSTPVRYARRQKVDVGTARASSLLECVTWKGSASGSRIPERRPQIIPKMTTGHYRLS